MGHPGVEQLHLLQRIHLSQGIHFNRVDNCRIRPGMDEVIYRNHGIGMWL